MKKAIFHELFKLYSTARVYANADNNDAIAGGNQEHFQGIAKELKRVADVLQTNPKPLPQHDLKDLHRHIDSLTNYCSTLQEESERFWDVANRMKAFAYGLEVVLDEPDKKTECFVLGA